LSGLTYAQAAKFAGLASFRYILKQEDGSYAVVLTWLAWVSAAILVERRMCTTETQIVSLDSGNAQMLADLDHSRHSIKRRSAKEGYAALARYKTRCAARARHDPAYLVPGVEYVAEPAET
jgi:hypothetical protein